ncbi:ATP-binding protein [Reichenbachiella agarivorans]|uniref:histidine kinase n=1 Tax=Reichenbachiella agarivorans TaxID=2979464 RepID=A0ABY6CTF2_9BACT|nr:ATP-binding protein [Reichenbachiella agarivorans]UXP33804.1 ATP-binding protein [Reichenbachiella agarivorans]
MKYRLEEGNYKSVFRILESIAAYETDPEELLKYSEILIVKAQDLNNDSTNYWLVHGYVQKGNALRLQGNLDHAIAAYFKSAEAAKKINYQGGLGTALLSIGAIYANNNDHEKGIKYRKQAISVLRETADSISLAAALMNTGYGYYLIDQYDSALLHYEESGSIYERKNYVLGKAYNLGNAGLVYAKQGKTKEAEEQLNEAIKILKELEDSYAITEFEIEMANIYVQKGDKITAERYLHSALSYAQQDGLKERIRDASLQLSELYSSQKKYEQAYYYQSQYITYRDSINNEETIRKMADLRTEFEVGQKQAEIDLKQKEVDLLNQEAYINRIFIWSAVAVVTLLLILTFVLYKLYRLKVRTVEVIRENRQLIEDQRDELERLNMTKDRFFSIISHDLRGPVSNFSGVASLIQMYIESGEYDELQRIGGILEDSSYELSSLLDNLLDWAMSQQGHFPYNPEEVSLEDICNPSLRVLSNSAKAKKINMTEEVWSEYMLYVDQNSATTIIRNLLSNSLKFTPEGGEVTLSVDQVDDMAVICVRDTGIGIPQDKMETLFGFEGSRKRWGTKGEKGVGLGLNLVQEFIALNKGRIEVDSEEGKGTEFRVYLPLFVEKVES